MSELARQKPIVWIVDDSATERAITERALGEDYEYERFGDGSEVVERLGHGAKHPDVLLLDWVMPGMPGDEVCRYLRSDPRTIELPIIFVTASRIEIDDVVAGLESGANDYVARPFAAAELRARVENAIRAKQLNDAAQRERFRLSMINGLGRALFEAGSNINVILDQLVSTVRKLADGCAVQLLPGDFAPADNVISIAVHARENPATTLAAISSLADPVIYDFATAADAKAQLPPAYHPYIDRFGLRNLAILPIPVRSPVQGVVTITRDGDSAPLTLVDIETIETCIEYASLALQNAMRFELERVARGQLQTVLEQLPIGIAVTDTAGTLTMVNAAAQQIIPRLEQARSASDVFALANWSTPEGEPIEYATWMARAAGSPTRTMLDMEAGDTKRTLSIASVPLLGSHDVPVGIVTAIEDITAAREVDRERERVARFQQEMLGIVGHDLRTPIQAVVSGLDVIGDMTKSFPDAQPTITRLTNAADRMTNIVEQLLDITRARLGTGIPLDTREVGMVPVIKRVIDELKLANPRADLQLTAETDVVGIWDPDRLAQVLSNLASNALQYGAKDSPVMIALHGAPSQAIISVHNALRDFPIPADVLATLFEPYRRGRDRDKNYRGLGLGLYIAKEIIRAHRGSISARSDASGTEFRIELPAGR